MKLLSSALANNPAISAQLDNFDALQSTAKKIFTIMLLPMLQMAARKGLKLLAQIMLTSYLSDPSNPANEKLLATINLE